MVLIPAGDFPLGIDSDNKNDNFRPQHKVSVPGFYIDVYEVTNAEYKVFCDATKRDYPPNPSWDPTYFLNKPNYPVLNVTWEDATAYAAWVGKRLPTEEEWEKAARGIEARNWPWGKDYNPKYANLADKDDSYDYTAPIGSFPSGASTYGIQDMVGNVWEWTSSNYISYPGSIGDPRYGDDKYRVIRGGGYNSPPKILRTAAFRFPGERQQRYEGTGFRCAKSQ
jgi:formylglycine-generating enzyme required for sulfatase activity